MLAHDTIVFLHVTAYPETKTSAHSCVVLCISLSLLLTYTHTKAPDQDNDHRPPLTYTQNPDGSAHHCEDPFLWRSTRGWHLLVHNQQGPQGESAYAYSRDGHSWTLSPTSPYDCTVRFNDGSTAEASGCGNRPQILFNDKGVPVLLTNGAFRANPVSEGNTYTLFRPITQPSEH